MARKSKSKGKSKAPPSSTSSSSARPPPSMEPPAAAAATIAVLTEDALRDILRRLHPADLLRAALTCHRWRRISARCLPRAPPLLGYFFHPRDTPPPPPIREKPTLYSAVFAPLDADSPRLSLAIARDASRGFALYDSHQGLLLFEPVGMPKGIIPRLLVVDPASRHQALLPPPPRNTLVNDRWRRSRYYVGSALLSRAHPSKLCFKAVCITIDDKLPRAWVASFDDGECRWQALPRSREARVDFDPWWFEGRCVHAAGNIYWHICNSCRLFVLDPTALQLSFLLVPAELGERFCKYRVGEVPEDGRLCVMSVEHQEMQLWVRGEASWSDNGWLLERTMDMRKVYDAVPSLPKDTMNRIASIWLADVDAGRTGKLFIKTWGYGRFSFHMETGKLERLVMKDGKEYGDPMYAYFLAWPPAFLAPEH